MTDSIEDPDPYADDEYWQNATDEQFEQFCRAQEWHFRELVDRTVARALGLPARCGIRRCRRERVCAGEARCGDDGQYQRHRSLPCQPRPEREVWEAAEATVRLQLAPEMREELDRWIGPC